MIKPRTYFQAPVVAVLVTVAFCMLALSAYVPKTLLGDFNRHMLPSKMFGIPAELRQHGLTELYSKHDSGWDGQFYYYVANDILARKDTAAHLDAAAYRYQRIGLPLAASLVARMTFQDWVSPATYYVTSLGLIAIATFMAAAYFRKHGIHPFWALAWSLGYGTQVTLLNGLPDAAADALLIIAILSLAEKKFWIYSVAAMFAALSREVYVLVPAVVGLYAGYRLFHDASATRTARAYFAAMLPHLPALLAVAGWQWYLRQHFGVSPSSQAAGILSLPFVTTIQYLFWGLSGHHPLMSGRFGSYKETMILLAYVVLLYKTFMLVLAALRRMLASGASPDEPLLAGFYLAILVIIGLYTALGPTVVMHETGYLKAANIFLFVVPFVMAGSGGKWPLWPLGLLIFASVALFWERIDVSPNYGILTAPDEIVMAKSEPACLAHPRARLVPDAMQPWPVIADSVWGWGQRKSPMLYSIRVRNDSDEIFYPYRGKGSVNLSYRWLNSDQAVVKEGERTLLSGPLESAQETVRPVVVEFPSRPGDYILRFSLVQEGCFWFYGKEPSSGHDIRYQIK